MLTLDEQINHLKNKGITFSLISEENAKNYLKNNNFYFKLSSYRKNYKKYMTGENENRYISLDFGHLRDLAIIDMDLRYMLAQRGCEIKSLRIEKMKLWTIQSRDAFNKMQQTGLLRADEEHLLFDGDLKDSYLWMSDQMSKRIGPPPSGVRFPVWAWYQWEGTRKRPDMRHHGRGSNKGEEIVLLTIEVPDDKVLLSDFDYWHFVLNDCEIIYPFDFEKQCSEAERKNIMTYLPKLQCGKSKKNG